MNGGGPLESSVTLDDVFTVVSARRVPLAPELAGYLVLEVADCADPQGGDVDPRSVYVGEEGTVALVKPKREGATGDAEASIRAALARLLEASGSQTPALAAASKRQSGAGLSALAEELEAALIPVNRAAGRRALARLAREVKRVTLGVGRNALPSSSDGSPGSRRPPSSSSAPSAEAPATTRSPSGRFPAEEEPTTARGQIPPELMKKATPEPMEAAELPTMQFEPPSRGPTPSEADVDALIDRFSVSEGVQQHARELKAMAGLEPTPPPPSGRDENGVDALLSLGEAKEPPLAEERPKAAPPVQAQPAPGPAPRRRSSPDARRVPDERQLPTQPSQIRKRGSLTSAPQIQKKRGPWTGVAIALAFVGAGVYGVWKLAPSVFGAGVGEQQASPSASATTTPKKNVCKRTLTVTDVPPHSEVLLREGLAPVEVHHLPVGAHLEFVATADGYVPKRLVVPESAAWENGSDGVPRFETAVQMDRSKVRPGSTDMWPAPDPGSMGKGSGQPGTVRVVSSPRGAEIWMLVGGSPEAQVIEDSCEEDVDVLVAGPTTFRKRLHLSAADFTSADTPGGGPPPKIPSRAARVSAK
jgi:hypothetical protein